MAEEFGWIEDPEAVAAVSSELPTPLFADTDANNFTDIPKEVMPWKIQALPPRNQGSIGSCTAHGTCRPIEYLSVIEISKGQKESYKSLNRELNYGLSRVAVGGGRFKGQDGSTGAWSSLAAQRYGSLDEAIYGSYDLRVYDISRCKKWGNDGVPEILLPEAEKHQVVSITKVTSCAEAEKALAQGYFINLCSNVGYSGLRRNAEGIVRASGTWYHSMSLIGMKLTPAGERLWCIENSWGVSSTKGPQVDLPNTACWWSVSEDVEKALKQGDSWSFSNFEGFPMKTVDWRF